MNDHFEGIWHNGTFWVKWDDVVKRIDKAPERSPKPLQIYDAITDQMRPATQADLDQAIGQNYALTKFYHRVGTIRTTAEMELDAIKKSFDKKTCPECRGRGQSINADGKEDGCISCGRRAQP